MERSFVKEHELNTRKVLYFDVIGITTGTPIESIASKTSIVVDEFTQLAVKIITAGVVVFITLNEALQEIQTLRTQMRNNANS